MARLNLLGAADAVQRWPDESAALGVTDEETAAWRAAAEVAIPYDEALQVHKQDTDFTDHDLWDFERDGQERRLPAAAARALLRHLPQAGDQAGRPDPGHAVVRRHVHAGREGPGVRLLRAVDRARLVAVGLHPGRGGRRGRAVGPGRRLSGRGRAGRPARPGPQLARRPAHRLAGRDLAGHRRRVRRDARLRRPAVVPPAAGTRLERLLVRRALARSPDPGDGGRVRGDLRVGRRRRPADRAGALRRAVHAEHRHVRSCCRWSRSSR